MLDVIKAHLANTAIVLLEMPFNIGEKLYYLYLIMFVCLGYLSYRLYYQKIHQRGFLKFLFPKSIYLHKSARIDYGIFLTNLLISPLLLLGVGIQTWFSTEIASELIKLNSGQAIFIGSWDTPTYLVFILGFTLAADFSVYVIHRFAHRSDVFWPIHALHHSAEVMTPMTLFRKHPVWNVLANFLSLCFTGLFQGVFVFVFYGGPGFEILFGINTVYVLYNFFGANLRHSHVWLSWGKPLSYLFISPAMHQIHHDPERMKKNYGEVFAIWDWMFGTLYIPEHFEEFEIGLGQGITNPHDSLAKAYYVPLLEVCRVAIRRIRRTP